MSENLTEPATRDPDIESYKEKSHERLYEFAQKLISKGFTVHWLAGENPTGLIINELCLARCDTDNKFRLTFWSSNQSTDNLQSELIRLVGDQISHTTTTTFSSRPLLGEKIELHTPEARDDAK